MKRFISVLLIITLLVSSLSACSVTIDTDEIVEAVEEEAYEAVDKAGDRRRCTEG